MKQKERSGRREREQGKRRQAAQAGTRCTTATAVSPEWLMESSSFEPFAAAAASPVRRNEGPSALDTTSKSMSGAAAPRPATPRALKAASFAAQRRARAAVGSGCEAQYSISAGVKLGED